ncbi:hypothetical protein BS17DRAFT_790731 [Gyrodon lividus]|nr:hypothetical protein BS17DRAFT_790731 [Gyrodon lividus]
MKVWHSNHNPQPILSYYLEIVSNFGYIAMVTQSDPGTENFGITNAQTMLHQMYDPLLTGFVQHHWMQTKKNITPEIAWSQLHRRFAPDFESLRNKGVDSGWYDPDNTLQLMLFHWLFIPWLQNELDQYRDHVNNTQKCWDRNKMLPHGIPELIHTCAKDYSALDFKIMVSCEAIEHIRQLYIKPDHIVFNLLPAPLCTFIKECYAQLGSPVIHCRSIWTIYLQLLKLLQQHVEIAPILMVINTNTVEEIPLMGGLADLPENDYYMGGVGNGQGLQEGHVDALEALECDEPQVDNNNEVIDAGLSLWVDRFSDADSEEEAEDVDEMI